MNVRDIACGRHFVAILKLAENPSRGGILAHGNGVGERTALAYAAGQVGDDDGKAGIHFAGIKYGGIYQVHIEASFRKRAVIASLSSARQI